MEKLLNIDLKKLPNFSETEEKERKENLRLFLDIGFPNKKNENWKFTDLNSIINKNFKNISINESYELENEIDFIKILNIILLYS